MNSGESDPEPLIKGHDDPSRNIWKSNAGDKKPIAAWGIPIYSRERQGDGIERA